MIESLIVSPDVAVSDAEFRRLLGYPPDHDPDERVKELSAATRAWFAAHGRPWVYMREATLELSAGGLRFDGIEFTSAQLREHLHVADAKRVMLVAVSAGAAIVDRAAQLWKESKPDEYFFTEVYGAAVVESLVASMNGRICDLAAGDGLMAVPHYSPGYAGWDIADQKELFVLIAGGLAQPLPERVEVLESGMLKPKKSLLGVFGLVARTSKALASPSLTPCERCSFMPCQYRRAAYRHPLVSMEQPAPLNASATYSVSRKALAKWAEQRLHLLSLPDGGVSARFRFDGTTCSNMGRPLAFDYAVTLAPARDAHRILATGCAPAPGDTGHMAQCAYLSNADKLMASIAEPPALVGRPLDEVLAWQRESRQSGCYCDASSRAHKWGLALQTIHFALVQARNAPAPAPVTADTFSN